MSKIERLDSKNIKGSYNNETHYKARMCFEKINELIDTVNKLTQDKGEECVLCNGLGRIKDGMSNTSDCYRLCPQCHGQGNGSGMNKESAEDY